MFIYYVNDLHEYLRKNIELADQKANIYLVVTGGAIVFILTDMIKHNPELKPLFWIFAFLICLVIGAFSFGIAVYPRLKGSPEGLIYFGAIANHSDKGEYAKKVLQNDLLSLLKDKLENCHELAQLCQYKYRWLRIGIVAAAIGFSLGIVILYWDFTRLSS